MKKGLSANTLRLMIPVVSLAVLLVAVFWLQPRAMSYMGMNLLFNLAVPIALATIAQMLIIAVNDLDLSIEERFARCQPQPAHEFQSAKAPSVFTGLEGMDRLRVDPGRRCMQVWHRRQKGKHQSRAKRRRSLHHSRHHPARRWPRAPRPPPFSAKRAASCSVIAPASSSASTMVTALR